MLQSAVATAVPEGDNGWDKKIEDKILHTLNLYPVLNPSMLHSGIGPQVPSQDWKPILENLITRGVVIREQKSATSPSGRIHSYTRLSLAEQ